MPSQRSKPSFFATMTLLLTSFAGIALGRPSIEHVVAVTNELAEVAKTEKRDLALAEVLFRVGKDYPELRSNYVLVTDSKSRQGASFEFPRVIAHTKDARFAMAFNGNPDAPGYYEIEMYEFKRETLSASLERFIENTPVLQDDYRTEAFHFRRIVFKPRSDYKFKKLYARLKAFPHVGPADEALCQSCHGHQSLRPNWEAYDLWEGTYFKTDQFYPGSKYRLPYGSPEHQGFDQFYTNQAGKGRYRFLVGLKERFVLPTKDTSRIPPSQFTQVAGYLNYRRLAHLILESKEYDTYKYAVLGALYDCENFKSFLPPRAKLGMAQDLDHYIDDTRQLFQADPNRYFLRDDESQIGKLRYLFEGRGISMVKWSMTFRRAPYTFVTPGGMPGGFISTVMTEYDRELEAYRVFKLIGDASYGVTTDFAKEWTGSMVDMVNDQCKALEVKSCEAFARKGLKCSGH